LTLEHQKEIAAVFGGCPKREILGIDANVLEYRRTLTWSPEAWANG
jgi:hypothetical protein